MGSVSEQHDLELQKKQKIADRHVEDSERETPDNYGGKGRG